MTYSEITFEPMSNDEALEFVKSHFGSSFVGTVSRSKYTAKVRCIVEGGEEKVVTVSLPRKNIKFLS